MFFLNPPGAHTNFEFGSSWYNTRYLASYSNKHDSQLFNYWRMFDVSSLPFNDLYRSFTGFDSEVEWS